jgi:uncharacterized protein YggE
MKKTFLSISLLLTLAALISGCAGTTNTPNTTRTLDVSGVGKVKIKPDIAYVNIGVRSQSPEVMEAFTENSEIAENIIQKLLTMGIEQKDIQTRNFNIYQQQEPRFEMEEETRTSYVVENTVAVVVRDLDALGEVLSTMVSEGANTIHGVSFDIEDREAAIEEARQLAIQDAKSQAEAIADAAGVKLGDIRKISINQNGGITPRVEFAEEAAMGSGAVPISSGTMTVQVTANLSYDID